MQLLSLHVRNFRNYRDAELAFSSGKNILLGQNGQGKTNLLEALYFLSHSRSNRTGSDRELILTGEKFATVSAFVTRSGSEVKTLLEAQFVLSEGDRLKTILKVNGSPLQNRSQLLGYLPTVSFFLSDLLLLRGAPEDRRRWLDAAIIQYDKRHFTYLTEFQKVRLQKNRLLKQAPDRVSASHLEVWNQQFIKAGARLVFSRLHYLSLIQDLVMVKYLELAAQQEALSFLYQASSWWADGELMARASQALPTVEEIEASLTEALHRKEADEIRRATCLVGPHRDDLRFFLSGMEASTYGSQGQQRSIVLALKLTELALLTQKLGEQPVFLLDDVMAELDPKRQACLLDRIEDGMQVFLTTTHLDHSLQPFLNMRFSAEAIAIFQVEAGTVRRETRPAHV